MQCELKNIEKRFGKQVVFKNLSFSFDHCGLYVIQGESGSGKTTFLNILAGYESFDGGSRNIDSDFRITCIFQNYELIDALTVKENIELYESLYHQTVDEKSEILSQLGLIEILEQYPNECSHGQQQRIGIARALMMDPHIILCDEPTESLDQENKERVMALLKQLAKTKVVIVATHELTLIQAYDPFVLTLQNHCIETTEEVHGEHVLAEPHTLQLDQPHLKAIISSLLRKRTRIQMLLLSIFSIGLMLFIQVNFQAFYPKNTRNALNADVIYLTGTTNFINRYDLQQKFMNFDIKPILNLSLTSMNGKYYRTQIVPYVKNENDFLIVGETSPKNNGILINQNAAKLFMQHHSCAEIELLGKEVDITYEGSISQQPLSFQITGILQEDDAGDFIQMYYDTEGLKAMIEENEASQNIVEVLLQTTNKFSIQTTSENIEAQYKKSKSLPSFETYQILMLVHGDRENEMGMYRIVFITMIALLGVIEIFYILYELKKEWNYQIASFALLHTMQVPLDKIKFAYWNAKRLLLFIPCIGMLLEIWLSSNLFSFSTHQYRIQLVVVACYAFVITLGILMHVQQLREEKISHILKEQKDYF